jgi:glycogen operon protein
LPATRYCYFVVTTDGDDAEILLMINSGETAISLQLTGKPWHCVMDTSVEMGLVSPVQLAGDAYVQQRHSMSLWVHNPTGTS